MHDDQVEFSRDWVPDSIFGSQSVLSTRLKSKEEEEEEEEEKKHINKKR